MLVIPAGIDFKGHGPLFGADLERSEKQHPNGFGLRICPTFQRMMELQLLSNHSLQMQIFRFAAILSAIQM
jgi:hypothetical protein